MKQYEEKNAPMLNHDITLEEIEAACRAHQKENDNRNMAEECRTIAREQKEKMQAIKPATKYLVYFIINLFSFLQAKTE